MRNFTNITKHKHKIISGVATLYKDRSTFITRQDYESHQNKRNIIKLKHAFTYMKKENDLLITFHTSKPQTFLTPSFKINNLAHTTNPLIKYSNPVWSVDTGTFEKYAEISYNLKDIPSSITNQAYNELDIAKHFLNAYKDTLLHTITLNSFKDDIRLLEIDFDNLSNYTILQDKRVSADKRKEIQKAYYILTNKKQIIY